MTHHPKRFAVSFFFFFSRAATQSTPPQRLRDWKESDIDALERPSSAVTWLIYYLNGEVLQEFEGRGKEKYKKKCPLMRQLPGREVFPSVI